LLRFYKLAYPGTTMDRLKFRENMGIMGLDTTMFLSDRIFNTVDKKGLQKVIIFK